MKKTTNSILTAVAAVAAAAVVLLALQTRPARADILTPYAGPTQTPVSGVTIAAGTATNVAAVVNCQPIPNVGISGTAVWLELSYNCATNYAATATFPTTTTNVAMAVQLGDGYNNWEVAPPAAQVLTVNGNAITNYGSGVTQFYGWTNLTLNSCPAVRILWITNACGVDANCKVTNVTVRAFVK